MGAAALPLMAIAVQAGSSIFEGVSESKQLTASAKVDRENARLTELQGAFETEDIRRRARAVQGEALVAVTGMGNAADSQSAQDLIFQNQLEAEYAVLSTRYSAQTEAHGLRVQAAQKKRAARNAVIGGVMRAGAAAITGLAGMKAGGAEQAALDRRANAFFPGGQRLPMPAGSTPSFVGPRY